MTRGLARVLTFLVLAFAMFAGWYSGQRADYFPDSLRTTSTTCISDFGDVMRQPILHEAYNEWFSGELSAFGEPSLYRRPPSAPRSIRFTWLRSFHDPVVVRIDADADGQLTMTARRRPGGQGFGTEPGVSRNTNLVRRLSSAEASALQAVVQEVGLFEQPSSGCQWGADGAQWIIEAVDPQRGYLHRNHQSPSNGLEHALGLHLLALTGWDVGPVY